MAQRSVRTPPVPRISAAICVPAGVDPVPRAIESLLKQTLPLAEYEILLFQAAATAVPVASAAQIRWIDGRPGSRREARQMALSQASAGLVAFLDGSAVAEPDWLASLCRTFDAFGDLAQAIGGRVGPLWSMPRPVWLGDDRLERLGLLDLGEESRFLAPGERISALNLALRKAVALACGGFAEAVWGELAADAVPDMDVLGLTRRLAAGGGRIVYDPQAVVHSLVPAERLQQGWFRRAAAWEGVLEAAETRRTGAEPLARRWQTVKDFFYTCPPPERTVRGLIVETEDPSFFDAQLAALRSCVSCLLQGAGEGEDA